MFCTAAPGRLGHQGGVKVPCSHEIILIPLLLARQSAQAVVPAAVLVAVLAAAVPTALLAEGGACSPGRAQHVGCSQLLLLHLPPPLRFPCNGLFGCAVVCRYTR